MASDHQLLTVREVADDVRVSTMTVYRLIKSGALPGDSRRQALPYSRSRSQPLPRRADDCPGRRTMARRLIGLDIGTNAVTIAEVTAGSPPRLERFGQVALPRDAMREGEVVDDRAVTDAIARLRTEVDVKKAPVPSGPREPACGRPPGRDAGDEPRRARERAAVPGRRPHPDPDRRSRARLRDPRHRAPATTASRDAGAARRRARGADGAARAVVEAAGLPSPRSTSCRSR